MWWDFLEVTEVWSFLFAAFLYGILFLVTERRKRLTTKEIYLGQPDSRMPLTPTLHVQNDLVIIINLSRNRERMNKTLEQAQRLFHTHTIIRMEGVEMEPRFKTAAILKSHLQALKNAESSECESVIILEDDVEFTPNAKMYLDPPINYEVYMLANYIFAWGEIENCEYRRLFKASTASAYQVRKRYIPILINLFSSTVQRMDNESYQDSWTNDSVWFPLQEKDLWIGPPVVIANQREGWCAIGKDFVNNTFHISEDGMWGFKSDGSERWRLDKRPITRL